MICPFIPSEVQMMGSCHLSPGLCCMPVFLRCGIYRILYCHDREDRRGIIESNDEEIMHMIRHSEKMPRVVEVTDNEVLVQVVSGDETICLSISTTPKGVFQAKPDRIVE